MPQLACLVKFFKSQLGPFQHFRGLAAPNRKTGQAGNYQQKC